MLGIKLRERNRMLGLVGALVWSGCLTVDGVSIEDDPAPVDGDPVDGDFGPDGEDGVDAGPVPCVDRGTYVIDEVEVRGQTDACEARLVCIQGQCVDEPDCAPGVTTACKAWPGDDHGTRTRLLGVGDYFYWLENGTTDELGNYNRDGALVRMKPGEWTREVVLSDLDFFSTSSNTIQYPDQLRFENGWIVATGGVNFAVRPDAWSPVFSGDEFLSVDEAGIAFLRNENTGQMVARNLDSGEELSRTTSSEEGATFAHGGVLAAQYNRASRNVALYDSATSARRRVSPAATLIGFDERGLIHWSGEFIGFASLTDDELLTWRNVRRITSFRVDPPQLQGGDVIWGRYSPIARGAVILRGALGGDEPAQVLTEMTMLVDERDEFQSAIIATTDRWVSYMGSAYVERSNGTVHFAPIAAD